MNLRPEEQKALVAAKAKVQKYHEDFFIMAREYDRANDAQLATMGQRNGRDAAIASSYRSTAKDIDKVWEEFICKFPD